MKALTFLPRLIALAIFTLLFNTYSYSQWSNISPSSNYGFIDITFPSQQIGYAKVDSSSGNFIYKTLNAGLTWQRLNINVSPITGFYIQSIYFVDDNTGFMEFRGNNPGLTSYLYKTVDGGANWIDKTPPGLPVGTGIADVFFTDINNGFVTTDDVLFKSTDGGNNWSSISFPGYVGFTEIDFIDANNGIVGAWDGTFNYKGFVYTTTDGGLNWDSLVLNDTYTSIYDVDYTTNNTAFALTTNGWLTDQRIYKTTNNGLLWDTLFLGFLTDSSDVANDMYFINDMEGYLSTTNGYIFKTLNGGVTWTEEHYGGPNLDIIAHNGVDIYVGGNINTLLTTAILTGIEDIMESNEITTVFPNPCNSNDNIQFKKPVSGLLQIVDLNGKLIVAEQMNKSNYFQLSQLNLSPGIYVMFVSGEENIYEKLVIN
jgi:photosystem II stability/assembly factor-like uncharacterized protein